MFAWNRQREPRMFQKWMLMCLLSPDGEGGGGASGSGTGDGAPDGGQQGGAGGKGESDAEGERPQARERDPQKDAELIEKFRHREKEWKREHDELEQLRREKQEKADADLSETEKLQKERDAIARERDELKREARLQKITAAAIRSAARYPELFADKVPEDTELDDESLNAVFKGLRKKYPELFKAASADGGAGGGPANEETLHGMDALRAAYADSPKKRSA